MTSDGQSPLSAKQSFPELSAASQKIDLAERVRELEAELEYERSRVRDLELGLERAQCGAEVEMTTLSALLMEALRDDDTRPRTIDLRGNTAPVTEGDRCWLNDKDCSRVPGLDQFGERMSICGECVAFKKVAPDSLTRLQEIVNSVLFLLERKQDQYKTVQDQLIQSEKLASLGELAAGLAHEINTPTGIILSRLDCMMLDQDMPEMTRSDLTVIRRHADRLRRITGSLTAFARRHKVEKRPVILQELLHELLEITERLISKGNVVVEVQMPECAMIAFADAIMIQQVFMNIIINARDAMEDGGTLTVRGYEAANELIMEFQDTGPGMDAETINRIFDPFFTTKEAKGTGLGLSVSYGIIKDHGGRIEVESRPGSGASFRIVLPRYAQPGDHLV